MRIDRASMLNAYEMDHYENLKSIIKDDIMADIKEHLIKR